MKYTAFLAAFAALLIANQSVNAQGALTPPGAPAESQKSLQEIYNAIQSAKVEFANLVQQAVPSVPGMVTVLGGTLPEGSSLEGQKVTTFYIGKFEVTWDEWQEVLGWAAGNGYNDLANGGLGSAGNHPVRDVNWYDVVKWCNALSEMKNLTPVYSVNGSIYRNGEFGHDGSGVVAMSSCANGYRLPMEAEWEWAARGGVISRGYDYSGSNDVNNVAWYWNNSSGASTGLFEGRGTWPVGTKEPNELGIYDMSGNVWEWCWEKIQPDRRRLRGGSWENDSMNCAIEFRDEGNYTNHRNYVQGFRLARSY
jgi:sulfatase modifying factor 1